MFCENCGKEIKDENKFCPYCGASVQPEQNGEQPEQSAQPEHKKRQQVIQVQMLKTRVCLILRRKRKKQR